MTSTTIAIKAIINKAKMGPLYDMIPVKPANNCDIEKRVIVDIKAIRISYSES